MVAGSLASLMKLPIVGAPLAGGPSTPALAAAVCEAGGFRTAARFQSRLRSTARKACRECRLQRLDLNVSGEPVERATDDRLRPFGWAFPNRFPKKSICDAMQNLGEEKPAVSSRFLGGWNQTLRKPTHFGGRASIVAGA
jgi:hypothetical protein